MLLTNRLITEPYNDYAAQDYTGLFSFIDAKSRIVVS